MPAKNKLNLSKPKLLFEISKFNFTPSPQPNPEELAKSKFTLDKIIKFKFVLK